LPPLLKKSAVALPKPVKLTCVSQAAGWLVKRN
jgi:hypothetical protein